MAEHTIIAIIFPLILCIDPINKEFDLVLLFSLACYTLEL